ncbi:MAG: DNA helicase RecG, partial [Candidatus Kerfeldbacteria bacterium]|nr:DNA helicase RecG [Candidatus Kerfeldbacteria bacterium]
RLFADYPLAIALLTHSQHQLIGTNNKNAKITATIIKKELKAGNINIVIGTHSLLQADIVWHKLGLIIVDEQHRFGVEQRRHLLTRTNEIAPHFLSLSATPIPRSLALSIYGDLDISLLKTMPSGRLPITTKIITPSKRALAYDLMKQEIANSHRVFIICPLIEENDQWGVKAVTTEFDRLSSQIFPNIKIGLLHGKLSGKQKIEALQNFKTGQTPILVTTSVVEVGVDIPEATIMAIEGAERFGVAQLHQFRGRVGRSNKPSHCLLFTNEEINFPKRLEALVKYANGFDLAEFDLAERGPGSLMGEIQSGYLNLKYADLINAELLATVRGATDYTLKTDSAFNKWPQIKQQLKNTDFHPE